MVAGIELPDRAYNAKTKSWDKTEKKSQAFELTFIKQDITKNRLVFISKMDFSTKEGEVGKLFVIIGNDSYSGRNFIKFSDFQA